MIKQLTDDAEILFRQIHPNFWQDGEPSSQPFMPTPKEVPRLLSLAAQGCAPAVTGFVLENWSARVSFLENHTVACQASENA